MLLKVQNSEGSIFMRFYTWMIILGIGVMVCPRGTGAMPPPDPRFPEAAVGFADDYLRARAAGVLPGMVLPKAVSQPTGSWNLLVIMIEFSDVAFESGAQDYFSELFFSEEGDSASVDISFTTFYEDMSAGSFQFLSPDEAGSASSLVSCTASQTYCYYGTGTKQKRGDELAEEAIMCADGQGLDISRFDNDGDGVAESILILHPGTGAEQTGEGNCDIWSHSMELSGFTVDGVGAKYAMGPELEENAAGQEVFSDIGIFAHEYGHVLGLPDLYDPDFDQSRGMGYYDLMSYGLYLTPPAYFSAWCRYQLGWLQVTQPTQNLCPAELEPVETSGEAIILYPDQTVGDEYFLVTFRTREGSDQMLPGRGLFIWHVDESKWTDIYTDRYPNDEPWYPGSDYSPCTEHNLVALEQADGQWDLEDPDCEHDATFAPCYWDEHDYWSGGASFTDSSTPGSRTYCDESSGIALGNIKIDSSDPGKIRFAVTVDPDTDPILSPVITSVPSEEAQMGELYQYQAEVEGTDPIECLLEDAPSGMVIDAATCLVSWTPNDTQIGTNSVILAAENCKNVAEQSWDIRVFYTPPDENGEEGGCGCSTVGDLGLVPLGFMLFLAQRKSRKKARDHS